MEKEMADEFERQAALAAEMIEKQRQEERLRSIQVTAEPVVPETKTLPPSEQFASDPTTISSEHNTPFIAHLTQTLEAKKQELEDIMAKDADSARKVAHNYIQSAIDSIEIQIAQEHFRLSTLEQPKSQNLMSYFWVTFHKIAITLVTLLLVWLGVPGLVLFLLLLLYAGVMLVWDINPKWLSTLRGFFKRK